MLIKRIQNYILTPRKLFKIGFISLIILIIQKIAIFFRLHEVILYVVVYLGFLASIGICFSISTLILLKGFGEKSKAILLLSFMSYLLSVIFLVYTSFFPSIEKVLTLGVIFYIVFVCFGDRKILKEIVTKDIFFPKAFVYIGIVSYIILYIERLARGVYFIKDGEVGILTFLSYFASTILCVTTATLYGIKSLQDDSKILRFFSYAIFLFTIIYMQFMFDSSIYFPLYILALFWSQLFIYVASRVVKFEHEFERNNLNFMIFIIFLLCFGIFVVYAILKWFFLHF